jgi:hypothetical protein
MESTIAGKRRRWIRYRGWREPSLDCRRRTTRYNGVTSGKKMFIAASVYRRKQIYMVTKKKTNSTALARRRPHACQ